VIKLGRHRVSVVKGYLLFTAMVLVAGSCIFPYEADIDEKAELLVVEGCLIKGESLQEIRVSTTSSLLDPVPWVVEGCVVRVVDDQDNVFLFEEIEEGRYTAEIPDESLVYGRQYMLRITTPEGAEYTSEYELLNASVMVDSLYFVLEDQFDPYTRDELHGIQFYIDIKAPDDHPRYYRWILEEAYEYTSSGPIDYLLYMSGMGKEPQNRWEFYRCWITQKVLGLYLSNTVNLTVNEKKQIPLNYVSTSTDHLKYKYTLLVNQYTLNEGAYNYWQQNMTSTEESGGLYNQQPGQPITNLYNMNDPEEQVLGYFWVSSKTEKRIFVPRPGELAVTDEICPLHVFEAMYDFKHPFPIPIRYDENGVWYTGDRYCFDCRKRGGALEPPEFWE
jgi:hypothetical protein